MKYKICLFELLSALLIWFRGGIQQDTASTYVTHCVKGCKHVLNQIFQLTKKMSRREKFSQKMTQPKHIFLLYGCTEFFIGHVQHTNYLNNTIFVQLQINKSSDLASPVYTKLATTFLEKFITVKQSFKQTDLKLWHMWTWCFPDIS